MVWTTLLLFGNGSSIAVESPENGDPIRVSGSVVFPVGKSELPQNDSLLNDLSQRVIRLSQQEDMQLSSFVVWGLSSPEGSYRRNLQLANQRAHFLSDYVNSLLACPADAGSMKSVSDVENYNGLCEKMYQANDADYSVVRELCDKYIPTESYTELESEIRRIDNGRLWTRLANTYFSQLRQANIEITFRSVRAGEISYDDGTSIGSSNLDMSDSYDATTPDPDFSAQGEMTGTDGDKSNNSDVEQKTADSKDGVGASHSQRTESSQLSDRKRREASAFLAENLDGDKNVTENKTVIEPKEEAQQFESEVLESDTLPSDTQNVAAENCEFPDTCTDDLVQPNLKGESTDGSHSKTWLYALGMIAAVALSSLLTLFVYRRTEDDDEEGYVPTYVARPSDDEVKLRETNLKNREQKCLAREEVLKNREQELAAHEEVLKDREQECLAHEKGLEHREQELAAREENLKNREQEFATLEKDLKNREQEFVAREEGLKGSEESLRGNGLMVNAKQRETTFSFLQNYIAERSQLIGSLGGARNTNVGMKKKNWAELEQMLNEVDNDRIARIRELYPQFTDEDIQLCMLVRLRMSNPAISNIYGISPNAVQHRKLKLKKDGFGEVDKNTTLEDVINSIT